MGKRGVRGQRAWLFSVEGLLVVAIAISLLLRLLNLGSRELWYDEALSVLLSNGQWNQYPALGADPVPLADFQAVLHLPALTGLSSALLAVKSLLQGLANDPHPPLSYLSLHVWMRLFGQSDAVLRALVALISLGAVGGIYGLGRCRLGHRGGLILAALLAANPFYLSHSLNLRMYGSLLLWTVLSAWALLELMQARHKGAKFSVALLGWSVLAIGSVSAGLLTQYLFAYWVLTLAVLVVLLSWQLSRQLNQSRWWHPLNIWPVMLLGVGGLLAVPWFLWGTLQQLRNRSDVLKQIATPEGATTIALRHLQNVAKTLGSHLVAGDWTSSLPLGAVLVAGVGAIAFLAFCTHQLWQKGERQLLGIALILGIFPLLLALTVDIATGKFTVGFGWGRSIIFILPGCLFLIALWLERLPGRTQAIAVSTILLLFLSVSIGDLSLRDRRMFQTVGAWIAADSSAQLSPKDIAPNLVAVNSKARGYILRIARYFPPTEQDQILALPATKLAPALESTLTAATPTYQQVLWLDLFDPVWSAPSTDADRQAMQSVLTAQYQLAKQQDFSGTVEEDRFTASLYVRR